MQEPWKAPQLILKTGARRTPVNIKGLPSPSQLGNNR